MQIDIVSDTICPWCYIGKRKFERALESRADLTVDVNWRPFQLNPHMPTGGMDRDAYLASKFGGEQRASQIYQAVAEAGRAVGIDFRFDLIRRTPSTLDSHRLIRWARSAGVQNELTEVLFHRYFLEGADIGDHRVLVETAREAGMDADLVADLLAKDADLDLIRGEDSQARQMGINSVPCFVIDRKYAISGAQDPPVFHKVFDLAINEAVTSDQAAAE